MALRGVCFLLVILLTACAIVKDVKTGREAFAKKQYHRAIDMLTKEYASESRDHVKAETAYLIAKSYDKKNDYSSAVGWYETSLNLLDKPESILALANAYKRVGNYEAAIKAFAVLYNETDEKSRFQNEINTCKRVKDWDEADHPYDFITKSLGANSEYAEYGVSVDKDGGLTFVSDRPSQNNEETYNWTGNSYTDVYRANLNGGFVELFEAPINSEAHDGPLCFNSDFTEVYFTRCESIDLRDEHCRLYYAYFENNRWTDPLPLGFFKEQINYGNPALMDSDSIIIFSARALGKDHELFYAVRDDRGWSEAFPMPDYINSEGDDMFPTAEADTLYFASDGHPGLGGLDVFKVILNPDHSFSQPENLMLPINSSYDDFHYLVTERDDQNYKGYVSTSRGLVGGDDIMMFTAKKRIIEKVEEPIDTLDEGEDVIYYLALTIKGKNESGAEVKLLKPQVVIKQNGLTKEIESKDANFIFEVGKDDFISVTAEHEGYLYKAEIYDIQAAIPDGLNKRSYTINKKLVLDPIILDKEITLENIYYDYEKWDIRADAQPSLDELSLLMKENPKLKIQLSSHTDCRGEEDFNQNLSQKRAQSAVDYIISSGIQGSRLIAKGYGESLPEASCICVSCSEDEHQANRRTTFKIVSIE